MKTPEQWAESIVNPQNDIPMRNFAETPGWRAMLRRDIAGVIRKATVEKDAEIARLRQESDARRALTDQVLDRERRCFKEAGSHRLLNESLPSFIARILAASPPPPSRLEREAVTRLVDAAEEMLDAGPFGPMVLETEVRKGLRSALRALDAAKSSGGEEAAVAEARRVIDVPEFARVERVLRMLYRAGLLKGGAQ